MENKHTKGKWTAKGIHIQCEGKTGRIGQAFLMDIPRPENKFKVCEESAANARLMAAAPEMLEALQQILELCDNANLSSFDQIKYAVKGSIEIADEVIQKATQQDQ